MKTRKLVLLEQISKEIKTGSASSLVEVLGKLSDRQITDCLTQESKDYLESIKPDFELQKGMLIKSKRTLTAKDTCWDSPKPIRIPEETIFMVSDAASNGDVFLILVEGSCIAKNRNDENYTMLPSPHPRLNTYLILVEGHTSRHPYDFGLVLKSHWEIVKK